MEMHDLKNGPPEEQAASGGGQSNQRIGKYLTARSATYSLRRWCSRFSKRGTTACNPFITQVADVVANYHANTANHMVFVFGIDCLVRI